MLDTDSRSHESVESIKTSWSQYSFNLYLKIHVLEGELAINK